MRIHIFVFLSDDTLFAKQIQVINFNKTFHCPNMFSLRRDKVRYIHICHMYMYKIGIITSKGVS